MPKVVFQRLPFSRGILLLPAGESWNLGLPHVPNMTTPLPKVRPRRHVGTLQAQHLLPSNNAIPVAFFQASIIAFITIPVFGLGSPKLNVGKSGEPRAFP